VTAASYHSIALVVSRASGALPYGCIRTLWQTLALILHVQAMQLTAFPGRVRGLIEARCSTNWPRVPTCTSTVCYAHRLLAPVMDTQLETYFELMRLVIKRCFLFQSPRWRLACGPRARLLCQLAVAGPVVQRTPSADQSNRRPFIRCDIR
jgi:hypothetical protein